MIGKFDDSSVDILTDLLTEFMTSYNEFTTCYQDDLSEELLLDWFCNKINCKIPLLSEDIKFEAEHGLRTWDYYEKLLLSAAKSGQIAAFWLYNFLRPDPYADDLSDDDTATSARMTQLFSILPYLNHDLMHMLATSKQIQNKDMTLSTNASSSMQSTMMSEWEQGLRLDSVHNMSATDISICAMDDLAYKLGMNATMMGAGYAAITTCYYLGKSLLTNQSITSDTLHQQISLNTLRHGSKNGLRLAITGALKVASTKNALPILAMASSTTALVAIAACGIECGEAIIQCAMGEINPWQAVEQASRSSVTGICTIGMGAQGAAIGIAALSALPVAVPIIGNFISLPLLGEITGMTIGTMIGGFAGQK